MKTKFARTFCFIASFIALLLSIASLLYISLVIVRDYSNPIINLSVCFGSVLLASMTLGAYLPMVFSPEKHAVGREGKWLMALNVICVVIAAIYLFSHDADGAFAFGFGAAILVSLFFGWRYLRWLTAWVKHTDLVEADNDRLKLNVDQLSKDLGDANGSAKTYQRQYDEELKSHQGCKANLNSLQAKYNELKSDYDKLYTEHANVVANIKESAEYKELEAKCQKLEADNKQYEQVMFQLGERHKEALQKRRAYRQANADKINAQNRASRRRRNSKKS
jgi:hypothetical protein